MRALREQPRLVAAKLTIALGVLIVAALIGSALASDGPEPPPDLRPRLERSKQLRHDQAVELAHSRALVDQLRTELRAATRVARARARANQRLRDDLRTARRSLARERDQ